MPSLSPRQGEWRIHRRSRRLPTIWSSVAGRITIFAALSLVAAMAAAASSALFAYETGQAVHRLPIDAEAANATANRFHALIGRERHMIDSVLGTAEGDDLVRARVVIASLSAQLRVCHAGRRDCVSPPDEFAATIDRDFAALMAAETDVLRNAVPYNAAKLDAARTRFDEAADDLHQSMGDWQTQDFEDLLEQVASLSARAKRLALYVAASTGGVLLIGLLGFVAVQRVLNRLGRLTATILVLARGDTGIDIPLRDAPDEVGRVARALEVFQCTARQLAANEAELRSINTRLDAALNNMLQGLCMFDAESRLIVWNERTRQIFGVPDDVKGEGLSFDEILDLFVSHGALSPEGAGGIKARTHTNIASRLPISYVGQLADGRCVSISITAIPDGGWLATFEDITERRATEAKIAYMAHHDPLTGLANRVLFQAELQKATAAARRGRGCALLYVDLDHFKEVNDTLGHSAGDALLRAVTARLRAAVRETDIIARLGGDEFAIIQTPFDVPDDAAHLARRIIAALAEPVRLSGDRAVVGTSIGIACAPADGTDPEDLMRKADLALYQAKADGRGIYRFFKPDMTMRLQTRHALGINLRSALDRGEFELHYQVQVALPTREALGFEALLRWRPPGRTLVPPSEFIPLAESSGLIVPIGEWVIRQACTDAMTWPAHLSVAVNLSAVQFKAEGLVSVVRSALAESGLAPHRLELEITETVMLQHSETTLQTLHELRALGVRIAMDDFGTGYSSLSYLQRFPFNRIKIDQSFVRGLGREEGSKAIIRAVIGLGTNLGIATIAEGIETETQLAQVLAEGGVVGQGYLFSRPVPAADVLPLLRNASERGEDLALPPLTASD